MFLPLIFWLLLLQIVVADACLQPGSNPPVSFVKFRMVLPTLLLPLPVVPVRTMRSSSGSSSSSEKVRVQMCQIICCTLLASFCLPVMFTQPTYHWRELPQVHLSSRQSFDPPPPTKCLLSPQNYACCDKPFVATNFFFSRHTIYVATNICRGKHNFVATSLHLS